MRPAALQVVDLVSDDDNQPSPFQGFGLAGRKFEPAGRMAAAIIEITQEQGGCLPQDLNAKGFTPDEVAAHWHLAQSLAAVELNLMGEKPAKFKTPFGRK